MPQSAALAVAIFNASDDTVEMLSVILAHRGYRPLSGHADQVKSGELDFIRFLAEQRPDAIIWDIAPPYDRNWHFFKLLREVGPLEHRPIVLTTTNKKHLDALVGQDTAAIEIVGKPYDLEAIVDAVTRALASRKKAGPRQFGEGRD